MANVIYLPPAKKFLKKIKDKKMLQAFRVAIEQIAADYTIGEPKTGDLRGIYGYDVYYDRTNYEISYRVEEVEDTVVIVIMVGTRENFYDALKRYINA